MSEPLYKVGESVMYHTANGWWPGTVMAVKTLMTAGNNAKTLSYMYTINAIVRTFHESELRHVH